MRNKNPQWVSIRRPVVVRRDQHRSSFLPGITDRFDLPERLKAIGLGDLFGNTSLGSLFGVDPRIYILTERTVPRVKNWTMREYHFQLFTFWPVFCRWTELISG